jgi:hypothetical protein
MFSLNHSQNTLKQVKVTFTLPPSDKKYTGNPRNEIIQVSPSDAVYSIKDSQGNKIKTSKGNATLTGTELNMGVNNGANATYFIHPLGDENYTYVLDNEQFVRGTLTISAETLSATSTTGTATYNGQFQNVTVINGINGTYFGSASAYGKDVGLHFTTIRGKDNYIGELTGTLTISPAPASSSGASGNIVYSNYDGSHQSQVVISNTTGLLYTGNTSASGTNAGTYQTTIDLQGNYTGRITGYLVISQATGWISLFAGGYISAGNTNTILFESYVDRRNTNASYFFSSIITGPGRADAYVQEGFSVECTRFATEGFTVSLTATINDPNYTASSATTTITFLPADTSSGGSGGTTYGSTTYY